MDAAKTPLANKYNFEAKLETSKLRLHPTSIETLQMNITKLCNQACQHCHVDSSPRRKEMMSLEVIDACLRVIAKNQSIKNIDITGGAPELNPHFRYLVENIRTLGRHVMVRHNLTVTIDPHPQTKEAMTYIPQFFASQQVEVISSLPYYQEFFTDKQRGSGVFHKSIASLKQLNALGYGKEGTGLILNLVYNPIGAYLPPDQGSIEKDYKSHLEKNFGIVFNKLFTITNMPIHRFKAQLIVQKNYEAYMEKLLNAFNPQAAKGVMCRTLMSVSYDGRLYDCDFNQMMDLRITDPQQQSIFDFDVGKLLKRGIAFREHCFGCTAGAGSSCGGAMSS